MSEAEYLAVAPFAMSVAIALLSPLVDAQVNSKVEAYYAEREPANGVVGHLRPRAIADRVGWAVDASQSSTLVVAPLASLLLLAPNRALPGWVVLAAVAWAASGVVFFLWALGQGDRDAYPRRGAGPYSLVGLVDLTVSVVGAILAYCAASGLT